MKHGGLDMEAKDNTETEEMVQMDKTIKVDESKENLQPRMKVVVNVIKIFELKICFIFDMIMTATLKDTRR